MRCIRKFILLAIWFCLLTDAKGSDLRLSSDHFSRTITARDTANYLIEVFVKGNISTNVGLTVLPDAFLDIRLSQNQVNTPRLIRLQVTARNVDHFGDHKLTIIASAFSLGLTDTLQVWLHIVDATVGSPQLIVDVPMAGSFEKYKPQTLEGAIMPAKPGFIKVYLTSQSSTIHTLQTKVDSMGLFHVNQIFTKHGSWQAIASWHSESEANLPDSISSKPIFFQIKRSPLRLTIAAEDSFRYVKNPKTLRVLGQITPDYANDFANLTITVQVTFPNKKDTSKVVVPNSINGKFHAKFSANQSGIYQIEATASIPGLITESFGSINGNADNYLYASINNTLSTATPISLESQPPLPNGSGGSGSSTTLTSDIPAGYVVIVVGHSSDYYAHLNIAYHLRDALIIHRAYFPDHIQLYTLTSDPIPSTPEVVAPSVTKDQLDDRIMEFLEDEIDNNSNFPNHKGLLLFWIGQTDVDGEFVAGNDELSSLDVRNIYLNSLNSSKPSDSNTNKKLWEYFNGVVFMHAGDRSGKLLQDIYDNTTAGRLLIESTTPSFSPLSVSSVPVPTSPTDQANHLEDFWTLCGLTTFSSYFLQATALLDENVKRAYTSAWNEMPSSKKPSIDVGLNDTFPTTPPAEHRDEILLGYNLSRTELILRASGASSASIIDSPQLDSDGMLWVTFDNPNQYSIRQCVLIIEPPEGSDQPAQCFKLIPEDSTTIWRAKIDVYKHEGLYRGKVFAQYKDSSGHMDFVYTSFERYRYNVDVTKEPAPPTSPVDVHWGTNVLAGSDVLASNVSTNDLFFSTGVSLFNYGCRGRTGYLAFPLISYSGNKNKQWLSLSPVAFNLGNILTNGKLFSNLWLHAGAGYIVKDNNRTSTKGDFKLVFGVRAGL